MSDPVLSRPSEPPRRVLLCLAQSCHGEFYLPLEDGEATVCPNDLTHPVAVYEGPVVFMTIFSEGERVAP